MKKILLLTIDGIGLSDGDFGNALLKANTPTFDKLMSEYPHSEISSSGASVGLPDGQPGNEKVGYMTIAAGEVIKQRSSFAEDFVDSDSLATNKTFKAAIDQVKKKKSTFHLMGLMSDGGVNSNIKDVLNLIEFLKAQEVNVVVDFIADGKDVEAKSALKYIEEIERTGIKVVSICGRYYAMDEEGKWDRTRIYYDLVRNGVGLKIKEIPLALKNCYMRGITDEFLPPILVESDKNIKDNDVIFWTNYLSNGSEAILTSISNPNKVSEFQTRELKGVTVLTMFPVEGDIEAECLIERSSDMSFSLGNYLEKLELSQARIADKNTFEYITYYFNGENDKKLSRCNNYLIDLEETIKGKKVQIDAAGISKQIIKCMEKDTDFIIASFGAIEQAAKTGNFDETIKMIEFIDECLSRILESAEMKFYTVVITSPFASIESMVDEEGKAITTHTTNKVPLIITDNKIELLNGSLKDVTPTILSYMDISIPDSMKNSNVLIKN